LSEAPSLLRHHFRDLAQQREATTMGMWLFIAQEIMFFGGLFAVYVVYRAMHFAAFTDGSQHLDWRIGAFNTAVLIGSSLTMALGVHAAARGQRKAIVAWLLATITLGSVFLGVKVVEYREKFEHHLVPGAGFHYEVKDEENQRADPAIASHVETFFTLYFGMTGLHAFHMIVGIPIIGWMAVRAWGGEFGPGYFTPIEFTGLYWHFVDIIWIFLFPLLYLVGHHH
jgi:cytochrome c oxidase subunit 3